LLFSKNYPKCRIGFPFLGHNKNLTKNLLYDGKYEKKRKCPSQWSEKNKTSFQHSLSYDGLCDSNDNDKSIKYTTQHKIKTTGKRSQHPFSQRQPKHSSNQEEFHDDRLLLSTHQVQIKKWY